MTRTVNFFATLLFLFAMSASDALAEDASGRRENEMAYNDHCRECHAFDKNDNRLGPSLYGIVGAKAGMVPGFAYSQSVKSSGLTWDEPTLDKWIANPNAVIPDNNMGSVYGGIDDPAVRAKVIAFLKSDAMTGAPEKK